MRILISLFREIPKWDKASQIGLGIALLLLILLIFILASVPDLRTPALIGSVGLLLAIQGIFMWGNRNLVSPYTQAQRLFIDVNFEEVVAILKQYIADEPHPIIDALVLLGNAYRNLGQLHESEAILRIALARRKNYHFALYGVAKIRLAKGDYGEAIKHLEIALQHGAPDIIRFDLAHAMLRLGQEDEAIAILSELTSVEDAHRALFAQYVLYVDGAERPTASLIEAGLPFWEAEAERFHDTPYGQAIAHDVRAIKQLL